MSTKRPRRQAIGKFSIPRYVINDKPELARRLLRDIIVVRAELDYRTDAIDYIGLCKDFDLVSELEPVPNYKIEKLGLGSRKITKIGTDGEAASMSLEVDPEDMDEDEDDDEPVKRAPIAKRKKGYPVAHDVQAGAGSSCANERGFGGGGGCSGGDGGYGGGGGVSPDGIRMRALRAGCDCDEEECDCNTKVGGARTGRVTSDRAAVEAVDKAEAERRVVFPIDHMAITREMLTGKK